MKKIVTFGLPVVLLLIGGAAYMTLAGEEPQMINTLDRQFLLNAVDARMMDWAEGKLAAEKGTTAKYQRYGKLMMTDQDKLMKEIQALAEAKKITLPENISEDKTDGLNRLKASSGETFDRRFRRMIIKDHKRDIDEFKLAAESDDAEIAAFAKRFLPMIEDHLQKARDLNK